MQDLSAYESNKNLFDTLKLSVKSFLEALANGKTTKTIKFKPFTTAKAPANNSIEYVVLEIDPTKEKFQRNAIDSAFKVQQSKGGDFSMVEISPKHYFIGEFSEKEKAFFALLSAAKEQFKFKEEKEEQPKPASSRKKKDKEADSANEPAQ